DTVLGDGKISPPDVELFTLTDDVDEVVELFQEAERDSFGT
ncbi:MAG: hypothetical protein QOJ48_1886, partial [Frankiales bacterium]|nr:hypothetical protein [Frankiales bacterium]